MKEHPDLTEIRYFVKVAELGNITRAAEELFITQPVLSRCLLRLEERLQMRLFERQRNGVVLTEKGAAFLLLCQRLLGEYNSFLTDVSALRGTVVGKLRIGYQKSSEELVIDVNKRFLEKYGAVNIESVRQGDESFVELLLESKLDFAYNCEYADRPYAEVIKTLHIKTLPYMLLVSQDNPLAARKSVHFSELANERFFMPQRSSLRELLDIIMRHCRTYGFSPEIIRYQRQGTTFIIDILTYNAVTILPYIPALERESSYRVKFIALEGFTDVHAMCLAWLKANTNPLVRAYAHEAHEYAKGLAEQAE